MDRNIEILDKGNIIDNFENLYYYNRLHRLHELLNKKNIHLFNIENIKIIMKHLKFVIRDFLGLHWKALNSTSLKKYMMLK